MARDDFKEATKRVLSDRVQGFCSNPTCGDRLHNRYVMTDLGGVSLGAGLDAGGAGETDDLLLLPEEQYLRRWAQCADEDGSFDLGDTPAAIVGARARRGGRGH